MNGENGYVGLDDIQHPALCRLYADWQMRRKGRAFPARADFDPLAMRYILGNMSLIEVRQEQPPRFFFRVYASNVAARMGFDLTGKFLEQDPDLRHREMVREHLSRSVTGRVPVLVQREAQATDNLILRCEAIALPLAKDGQTIDMLLTGFVWT